MIIDIMQQVSYVYLQESQIAFRPLPEVFAFLHYVKAIKENMHGEGIQLIFEICFTSSTKA